VAPPLILELIRYIDRLPLEETVDLDEGYLFAVMARRDSSAESVTMTNADGRPALAADACLPLRLDARERRARAVTTAVSSSRFTYFVRQAEASLDQPQQEVTLFLRGQVALVQALFPQIFVGFSNDDSFAVLPHCLFQFRC